MGCIIKFKGQSIPEEQFLQYLNKQIAINNLFEEDKTLANAVYEALGFDKTFSLEDVLKEYTLEELKQGVNLRNLQNKIDEKDFETIKLAYNYLKSEEKYRSIKKSNEEIESKLNTLREQLRQTKETKVGSILTVTNEENISEYKVKVLEINKYNDYAILKVKARNNKEYTIRVESNGDTKTGYIEDFVFKAVNVENAENIKSEISNLKSQLQELKSDYSDYYIDYFENETQITPQQKQQAQQLYSQYFDTIFPDSKVKDIVYHGTKKTNKFDVFDKEMQQPLLNTVNNEIGGFYFSEYGEYGKQYKVLLNISKLRDFTLDYEDIARGDDNYENIGEDGLQIKKRTTGAYYQYFRKVKQSNGLYTLYQQEDLRDYEYVYKENVKEEDLDKEKENWQKIQDINSGKMFYNWYVVFEPEQIHILGSKQDVEEFKNWVDNRSNETQYQIPENREVEEFGQKNNLSEKNIFTVEPIQSADKKAKSKAKIATQYIGFGDGITNSSTALYAKQAGKFANTGNYSSNDVIFVSIGGKRGSEIVRKQQQDKTIKEALKAIEAGATLITDNKAYVESNSFNEGEKRLAKNLEAKGYIYYEITIDGNLLGVWNKNISQITPQQKQQAKEIQIEQEKVETETLVKQKPLGTKEKPIQIYSDGSDIKGTGKIGYGSVFIHNGKEYFISGTETGQEVEKLKKLFPDAKFSNPTMEMLALTITLEQIANLGVSEHVEINQDYKGAVNYNELWSYSEGSQQREPKPWKAKEPYIKHLVDRAYKAIQIIESNNGSVKLNWVKGHAGNKMNELADKYAKSRDNISNMHDAYQTDSQQQILTRETEDKTILKINKINYSINHTTGIITALSDNGNKTITDESIISKVYSAFAEINGFGRVEYNGNTYSKVFNTIINMETGKVITDNNINNLFTSDIKTEVSKAVEVDSDVKTSSIILERKC